MINVIQRIKDIIELVRTPPGNALNALEINSRNRNMLVRELGPDAEKYANYGDFFVEYETSCTIVPRKEFFKHYEFLDTPTLYMIPAPIRTIKPL